MKGRHLRRRFSLQPSFMKDDDDKQKRDKVNRHDAVDDNMGPSNVRHKIVVMGAAKVGKTSIIAQFLYNRFSPKYKRTVEEMHEGNFSISGVSLTLDILDTSGAYEFPAMRALSISSADAFILVYDVTDASSFDEVRMIRDQIHEIKGTTAVPIVVVGNKIDLVEEDNALREIDVETTESVVQVDWENGFAEASAKKNENVTQVRASLLNIKNGNRFIFAAFTILSGAEWSRIFKELLSQAKITYNLSPALRRRRRQSLPPNQMGNSSHSTPSSAPPPSSSHVPSPAQLQHLQKIQERSLGGKRNSCIIS